MSIKDLFEYGEAKILKSTNIRDLKGEIESQALMDEYHKLKHTFVPPVDFSTASNFAKFGSAESYYEDSIERIYRTYPYDGSKKEKTQWENSSKFIDRYIFDQLYPRTTGYVNIGLDLSPTPGGTLSDTYYVYPTSKPEHIFIKGGPNADPDGNFKDQLDAGSGSVNTTSKANIWNHDKNRTSNLRFNPTSGSTVEFWMKKNAFAGSHSLLSSNDNVSEIIFDLWNSGSVTDDIGTAGKYGRFVIYVDKDAPAHIKVDQRSGSIASNASLDTGLTTIADGDWHHYAVVVKNTGSSQNFIRLYVDGNAVSEARNTLGSPGKIGEYTGPLVATIGAQITTMHGDSAGGLGYGKLSASIDEFRYWKSARDAKEIGRHWFTQVHGGTNSDNNKYDSTGSVDLGVYYKFNEGIVEDNTKDSVILDYSGRISNGVWTGYSSSLGARSTGSAINENMTAVTASIAEFRDPIIYSDHPKVTSLLSEMRKSGSAWDIQNNASIYHSIPAWILEEDSEKSRFQLKKLTQMIASYFDRLFLQIEHLPKLGNKRYFTGSIEKPHPFADVMMQSQGFPSFLGPELFGDADLLEQIMQRGEKKNFELSLFDIKNRIYQNIYNNLVFIYKSKGTEKSLRNTLRCYGIDDELIKINLYAGNETYEFKDTYKSTTVRKKYIDCNDSIIRYQIEGVNTNAYGGTIYQYPESGNPNSVSYISGAVDDMELSGTAMTLEAEVLFPKILNSRTTASIDFPGNAVSLFGMHTANTAGGTGSTDTTWASSDVASFSVTARKDESNPQYHSFLLTPGSTGVLPAINTGLLTASSHLYNNNKWNFAVRLKPNNYPYVNFVSGSNTEEHSIEDGLYWLEFYGINTFGDTVLNEFLVSSSLTTAKARQFLNAPKRIYAGASRTNFSGAIITPSNVKIGAVRYWLDYLENEAVLAHARDATNYGALRPSRNAFFAQNSGSTNAPRNTMMHTEIPQIETLALNWNFDALTGSDSNGQFVINDLSSGSMALAHDFDLYGQGVHSFANILKKQHTGRGDIFTPNTHKVLDNDWVYTAKQHLPEVLNSSDNVTIRNQDDDLFVRDSDLIHFFFGIEKSMYQTISEEMLKMFATVKDFNNLVGDPVNQYRQNYKTLEKIRELFFMRMGNTPDLDRYVDFYIWIDSAVTKMLDYLIPASANASKLRTMVEDHILSRSKYMNKFPTVDTKISDPEGKLKGIKELKYNWKDGHAPVENNLAFQFNGSDETLAVADTDDLSFGDASSNSPFSLSAWVNLTELDDGESYQIIGKRFEYDLYIQRSGADRFLWFILYDNNASNFAGGRWTLPASFNINKWYNIFVTYDGRAGAAAISGGGKFYLNGDSQGAATMVTNGTFTAMHNTTNVFYIGSFNNGSRWFTGLMNDVMVFAGTAEERIAKALSNFSLQPQSGLTLRSWWSGRGAQTSNVVADLAGNPTANPAAMTNMTTSDNVVNSGLHSGQWGGFQGFDLNQQKNNCLWWSERAERGQPSPIASYNTGVDESRVHILNTITTDTNVVSGTVPILSSSIVATYTGSTYALRRLSIPYIFSSDRSLKIHGGPNLQHNQKYDFVFSSVSKTTGSANQALKTYLAVSASKVDSSSICRDFEIFDGVSGDDKDNKNQFLEANKKKKLHFEAVQVHDGAVSDFKEPGDQLGKSHGHILANFNIYSSSADQDKYYATELSAIRLSGATITDLHHDVYGPDYEKPMQGPWVEHHVGGKIKTPVMLTSSTKQFDDRTERVESFTLVINNNEINVHPGNYHDQNAQKSWISKPGTAKRPVNIQNIATQNDPYFSGSNSDGSILMRTILGNYSRMRNYEVVNTPGRSVNNLWLRSGSKGQAGDNFGGLTHTIVRPQGDVPLGSCLKREHTLADRDQNVNEESGSALSTPETMFQVPGRRKHIANYPLESPWAGNSLQFGTSWGWMSGAIDFQLPDRTLLSGSPDGSPDSEQKRNRTVISEKFSAPGGFEVMSRGYLDPAHEAYSAYNALPYRNLSVRHGLQSGINLSSSGRNGTEAREALTGSRFSQLHEFMPQSQNAVDTAGVYEARNINLPHDVSGAAYSGRSDSLLSRHCGQFGMNSTHVGTMLPDDSVHKNWEFGAASYDVHNRPSFHKIHRNNIERLTVSASLYDNKWHTSLNTELSMSEDHNRQGNSYWVAPDHNDFSFGPDNSNDAPFSITAWVNMEWNGGDHRNWPIVAKCSGSAFEYQFMKVMSTGKLGFYLLDNSATVFIGVLTDDALTEAQHGTWIHVAAVYDHTGSTDANALKIYVNGKQVATTLSTFGSYTAMHNTATDLTIGYSNALVAAGGKYASGSMDEVAIWSHGLSDQEVKDIYQAPNPVSDANLGDAVGPSDLTKIVSSDPNENGRALYELDRLTAWWRFGDEYAAGASTPVANAFSQSVYDSSGNGHNITGTIRATILQTGDKFALEYTASAFSSAPPGRYYDAVITSSQFDNAYVTHQIPRTEQQYSWITSSLSV